MSRSNVRESRFRPEQVQSKYSCNSFESHITKSNESARMSIPFISRMQMLMRGCTASKGKELFSHISPIISSFEVYALLVRWCRIVPKMPPFLQSTQCLLDQPNPQRQSTIVQTSPRHQNMCRNILTFAASDFLLGKQVTFDRDIN